MDLEASGLKAEELELTAHRSNSDVLNAWSVTSTTFILPMTCRGPADTLRPVLPLAELSYSSSSNYQQVKRSTF